MPFISLKDRRELATKRCPRTAGERCYFYYNDMVAKWKKNPRWTTADEIYSEVTGDKVSPAWQRARELAWQVFFIQYVMPYEIHKLNENGDI
jgi:hypothetical protein